uniref:Sodium/hydrogen exchanger n=1 Tax=Amphimedon queenslandica TaxID=400682 RepID=A0A1X7TRM6_AMPQE
MSSHSEAQCYPLLHSNGSWEGVCNNARATNYLVADYQDLLNNTGDGGAVFYLPNIELDASDQRTEHVHFQNSAGLLLVLILLSLTILTIWVFKVKRFRVMHETGLSILYGIIIGVVIHYGFPSTPQDEFYLAEKECESSGTVRTFEIGDSVILQTQGGDGFRCSINSKVFRTREGDRIEEALLFDPELFFFLLLPPIIFYAGYSLKKRHFFRNIGSLLMYAFAGTAISCFVVGAMMYGWVLSTIDNRLSEAFATRNISVPGAPEAFGDNIIPSLLFGSLISATDPVTVLAIFHDLHVDVDLYSLVFGESVMNDAVAIVLYRSVDEYDGDETGFSIAGLFKSFGSFIGVFLGSFLLGTAIGLITALMMKFSRLRNYPLLETSMFILMSYSSFVIAELASLTGIVAILFCVLLQLLYINMSQESRRRTKEVFELINFLSENFVFSYMGLSLFTFANHQWVPGFIIFSFVAIFTGRVINIYVLSFLLNLGRSKKISFRFQHMLVFAGLRGAIAFALAIRNTETEERQLMFTTTLVIVLITVLICGGFTTLALQCLRIRFLIPFLTHHGRPLTDACPRRCPTICISCCTQCKPKDEE